MIIIFSSGQLGNQLFQYAAAKTLCNDKEWLIGIGFEELDAGFDGVEMLILNQTTLKVPQIIHKILLKSGTKIIYLLLKLKVFSSINEFKEKPHHQCQHGLFRNIKIIQNCYFQNESCFDSQKIKSLDIKPIFKVYAEKVLRDILSKDKIPVFVHIRRGDYCFWPSREYPAVLPADYYYKCIRKLRKTIPDSFFFFTSDDTFYVQDIFSNLECTYISKGNLFEDFALMSQCSVAILSASSFSWWAAYFAKQYSSKQSTIFLAPNYWFQHRLKTWPSKLIRTNFLNYVDVS